jgi:hypothetical protein
MRVLHCRWGVNTINVNGKTTTMVGSMLWGQEVRRRPLPPPTTTRKALVLVPSLSWQMIVCLFLI